MANTLKQLAAVTLSSSDRVLYGATSYTQQAIVKCITVANNSTAALSVLIKFDSKSIFPSKSIEANDAIHLPMTHIIEAGDTINGNVTTSSTAVDVYVSGIEVTTT